MLFEAQRCTYDTVLILKLQLEFVLLAVLS